MHSEPYIQDIEKLTQNLTLVHPRQRNTVLLAAFLLRNRSDSESVAKSFVLRVDF